MFTPPGRLILAAITLATLLTTTPTALVASEVDFVVTPTDIVVNSAGTEAVIEIDAHFGANDVESATVHIVGNRFTISGTDRLPKATNKLLMSFPPCTPNPLTGLCEIDDGSSHPSLIHLPNQSTQAIPPVVVVVGLCAVGYGIAHGFNVHACRGNGGIKEHTFGACGILTGSSAVCNDPVESPPDEPDIPDDPERPNPGTPPTTPPPDCPPGSALCDAFWDWNRGAMSGCLSANPDACF